ncbi:MAG: peptide chain release factor 1 [Bacillota bacterium]
MFERLKALEDRYEDLNRKLADPEVLQDQNTYQKYAKSLAEISEVVQVYREYLRNRESMEEMKEILKEKQDPELVELAGTEFPLLEKKQEELEFRLKSLLLPRDPGDEKNVIVEIRAGTGGEEAALFAGDLFRMYIRYAERQHWRYEVLSENSTGLGGYKEIIVIIEGRGAFSRMKYESGVHRVQRVPETETAGRIHTSAASVVVLPEAEEVEVEINPSELRIDVYHSSGHGGQSVNTTDSAVRITHLPTGMVVTCQDEKSQLKNKNKAMKILRARLLAQRQTEQQAQITEARRSVIRSGDRSEKIRTYNFPQNRLTDHRIGLTLHKLDMIINGDLDEVIAALAAYDQTERLKETTA